MSHPSPEDFPPSSGSAGFRSRGRLAEKLAIALFLGLLAAPGIVTLGRTVGGKKISGVPEGPAFSFKDWMSGAFQRGFEAWFDENFAMRNFYVRSSNQINFSVFGEITFKDRAQVTLGHRNSLFRTKYIHSYYGRDTMPPDRIEQFAADVRRLQDHLKSHGVAFLFMLTPSKPSIYPEDIPDSLRSPSGAPRPSNYDLLVPALNRHGVEMLDGRALAKTIRENGPYPVFPKSGFHWGYYGSFRVMEELISRMERLTGRPLRHFRLDGIKVQLRPIGSDGDAVQLAELWTPRAFWEPNPYPDVSVPAVPGAFVPRVLLVGDSFLTLPLYWLKDFGIASPDSEHNWYWKQPVPDMNGELLKRDVIILGMNEALLQWRGYGLIESVLSGRYQAYPMLVD